MFLNIMFQAPIRRFQLNQVLNYLYFQFLPSYQRKAYRNEHDNWMGRRWKLKIKVIQSFYSTEIFPSVHKAWYLKTLIIRRPSAGMYTCEEGQMTDPVPTDIIIQMCQLPASLKLLWQKACGKMILYSTIKLSSRLAKC